MRSMIGRMLCRLGFHRMIALPAKVHRPWITDTNVCKRPGCDYSISLTELMPREIRQLMR